MLFKLNEITKSYTAHDILRGVSFQINPNEKVGLVGRNGAGKTTVFRIITGEESPDSGDIVKLNGLKLGLLEQHVNFETNETVHTSALSAFKRIHDLEAEMRHLEHEMAENPPNLEQILEKYSDIQHEFELEGGYDYTARAEAILLGLGFDKEKWELSTAKLSGGQKNRLGMARLLLSQPDILLLDEPTNHLDVNSVEWLENFLQNYDSAFVIISHDRYFLDRTCTRIIEIDRGKAVSYSGNYSKFIIDREEQREIQRRAFENQQSLINKTEEFVRKNLAGQKTKQAKSRRNMLERMERVEAVVADKSQGNFNLRKVERAGQNVLTIEELKIGFPDKVLSESINFTLHRGDALGIIGVNGSGKTTFLRTILGNIRPLDGEYNWGAKTEIGYYSQNLDDLTDANEIIMELRKVAPIGATSGELRSFLARFLFMNEDVFKKVGDLSGGEKGRLALAKLIYSNCNVLVLDEPTNHLDIPSREALEAALDAFQGTILAISHDRFFLDRIANEILYFDGNRQVEFFEGNYTEFHDFKKNETRVAESAQSAKDKPAGEKKEVSKPEKSEPITHDKNLSKNNRVQIEKSIEETESAIAKSEKVLSEITEKLNQPEIAKDFEKLNKLNSSFRETQSKLESLYKKWEELTSQLN